jgi:tetratricopeptide (TPR) repeat protein
MLGIMQLSLDDFNYAVSIDSNRYSGIYFKAITHYYMGQEDSASKFLNKCILLDSTDDKPYYFRSKLKYINQDYNNALKDINIAINLNDNDADYYIARAKIYYFNDNDYDDDLAEDDLNTAIKMGSEEAKSLLKELFEEDEEK